MSERDTDYDDAKKKIDAFLALPDDERTALAAALLERPSMERQRAGATLVRKEYPAAAEQLILAAAYHAYHGLPNSSRDCLAWMELCLREERHDTPSGFAHGIAYHLYNWSQAEALAPWSKQDVFDELKEVKECLQRDDKESALAMLEHLLEVFHASDLPPELEI